MTEIVHSAPRRIYSCPRCGYRLRYNAPRCGECYTKTPIYNHATFWWAVKGAAAFALLAVGLLTFL